MKSKILTLGLTSLILSGCIFDSNDDDKTEIAAVSKVYYVGSDFKAAALYSYDKSGDSLTPLALTVHHDSKVLSFDKQVFVLERKGADNIIKLDPTTDKVSYQVALIDDSNPSDLVPATSGKGFLSYGSKNSIDLVDLATGKIEAGIDIAAYAQSAKDFAGAADLQVAGEYVYAALERFDASFQPAQSIFLKIDPKSNSIVDSILVPQKNCGKIAYNNGNLYASCAGTTIYDKDWNATSGNDGALISIDLSSKAITVLAEEKTLLSKPQNIAVQTSGKLFVSLRKAYTDESIYSFDISLKQTTAHGAVADAFSGFAFDLESKTLYAAERETAKHGLEIYTNGTLASTQGAKNLPPSSIAIYR